MAEENKETIEEIVEEQIEQPKEEVVEEKVDESKFESAGDDSVIKVDLSKPLDQESEEVEEEQTKEPIAENTSEEKTVVDDNQESPIIEEVTIEDLKEEAETKEDIRDTIVEARNSGQQLPENIDKLVKFMEETGGDISDYVNLNRDVSKMDDSEVLDEYYRETKSHLTPDERSFLLEDSFGYDEDGDDPKEIRKKKIALKEQVAEARRHLDGQKSKYYDDIKAGSKLTNEQQEAINFYHKYNEESEKTKKTAETFKQQTEKVFNDKFKGFDFKVGDKKFRFNVKDVDQVKKSQSDLNNFVNKFANKDKTGIEDISGYHKSIFTAMNADAIANHFYEQGKADATKDRVARDKNVNTNPRQTHGQVDVGGVKYKVLGESTSSIKNRSFKIKKKN